MKQNKKVLSIFALSAAMILAACGTANNDGKNNADLSTPTGFSFTDGVKGNRDVLNVKKQSREGVEITGIETSDSFSNASTSTCMSKALYQIYSGEEGINDLRIIAGIRLDKNDEGEYSSNYSFGFHISYSTYNYYYETQTVYNSFYADGQLYVNDVSSHKDDDGVKTISELFGSDSYTHFVALTICDIPADSIGTVFRIQSCYNTENSSGTYSWMSTGDVRYTSYQKTEYLDKRAEKDFIIVNDDTVDLKVVDCDTTEVVLKEGDTVDFYSKDDVSNCIETTITSDGTYNIQDLKRSDAKFILFGGKEYTIDSFNSLNNGIAASFEDNTITLMVAEGGVILKGEINSNGSNLIITGGNLTLNGTAERDCIQTKGRNSIGNLTIDCNLTIALQEGVTNNNSKTAINTDSGTIELKEGKTLNIIDYAYGIFNDNDKNVDFSGSVSIVCTERAVLGNVSRVKVKDGLAIHCGDDTDAAEVSEISASKALVINNNHNEEDNWEVTTKPSTDSDGKISKKCTVCGTVLETQTLPKLDSTNYSVKKTTAMTDDKVKTTKDYTWLDKTYGTISFTIIEENNKYIQIGDSYYSPEVFNETFSGIEASEDGSTLKLSLSKDVELSLDSSLSLNTYDAVVIEGGYKLSICVNTANDGVSAKNLTVSKDTELVVTNVNALDSNSALILKGTENHINGKVTVSNYSNGIYSDDGGKITIDGEFTAEESVKFGIGSGSVSSNVSVVVSGTADLNCSSRGISNIANFTINSGGTATSNRECLAKNYAISGTLKIAGQMHAVKITLDGGTLDVTTDNIDAITIEGFDNEYSSDYNFTKGTATLANTNSSPSGTGICNSKNGHLTVTIGNEGTLSISNFSYGVGKWNGSGTFTNNGVFKTHSVSTKYTGVTYSGTDVVEF